MLLLLLLYASGECALGADTNHHPLLQPPDLLPLLGAPGVGIDAQDSRDARLVLLGRVQVPLVGAAHGRDGRARRVAHGRRRRVAATVAAAAVVVLPRLLQHGRVRTLPVLGGDGGPKGRPVAAIDGLQAAHVDVRHGLLWLVLLVGVRRHVVGVLLRAHARRRRRGAVQAKGRHGVVAVGRGRGGGGVGEGGGGQQGGGGTVLLLLLLLLDLLLRLVVVLLLHGGVVPRGAEGEAHVGRLGQDGRQPGGVVVGADAGAHDAGELDAGGGAVAAEGAGRGHAAAGGLVDGARDGRGHDGGVASRRRARGHGGRPLAAVAAVAELVVVQAAGELGLLEVGGDVLVRHLLQAGLEQVDFLYRRSLR